MKTQTTIMTPGAADVLHGRGFVIQTHEGNRRLHQIVDLHKQDYQSSRREGKRRITTMILSLIQTEHGGRFLKRAQPEGWVEVPDAEALDKIGHTIRSRLDHKESRDSPLLYLSKLAKGNREGSERSASPAGTKGEDVPTASNEVSSGSGRTTPRSNSETANSSSRGATPESSKSARAARHPGISLDIPPPPMALPPLVSPTPLRPVPGEGSANRATGAPLAPLGGANLFAASRMGPGASGLFAPGSLARSGFGMPRSFAPFVASPTLLSIAAEERILLARLAELREMGAIERRRLGL